MQMRKWVIFYDWLNIYGQTSALTSEQRERDLTGKIKSERGTQRKVWKWRSSSPFCRSRTWCLSSVQLPMLEESSSNPCSVDVLLSQRTTLRHDSYSKPTDAEEKNTQKETQIKREELNREHDHWATKPDLEKNKNDSLSSTYCKYSRVL